jgi:hypothetical protein
LSQARTSLQRAGVSEDDVFALRSGRATAAVAARDAARAARFEMHLLALGPADLEASRAAFERRTASLVLEREDAVAHLGGAIGHAPGDLAARPTGAIGAQPGAVPATSREAMLTEDVLSILAGFADRLEQLLVELSEAANAASDARPGTLVAPRGSHEPARRPLERGYADAETWTHCELADAVWDSDSPYADDLAHRLDDGIAAIRRCLGRVDDRRLDGEHAVRSRSLELGQRAHELGRLADALDWMLPVDRASSTLQDDRRRSNRGRDRYRQGDGR